MYTGHPKKKFNYAEAKQIGYFIEVGDDEKESGIFRVKNMSTREEEKLSIIEIITKLKNNEAFHFIQQNNDCRH
jgi:histidyl-tRNA synthetase